MTEVLLSARTQSKRLIVRVTWACSSTARWACELRSRKPRKYYVSSTCDVYVRFAGYWDARCWGGRATRVSICHKSTQLWQCHTSLIATVHSWTTTTSFECDLRPREHVTSALIDLSLHWLPVAARIEFKICLLAYQSLNSTAPAYISDTLQPVSILQRQTNLRSATNSELCVPRTRLLLVNELLVQQLLACAVVYPLTSSEPPLYTNI